MCIYWVKGPVCKIYCHLVVTKCTAKNMNVILCFVHVSLDATIFFIFNIIAIMSNDRNSNELSPISKVKASNTFFFHSPKSNFKCYKLSLYAVRRKSSYWSFISNHAWGIKMPSYGGEALVERWRAFAGQISSHGKIAKVCLCKSLFVSSSCRKWGVHFRRSRMVKSSVRLISARINTKSLPFACIRECRHWMCYNSRGQWRENIWILMFSIQH